MKKYTLLYCALTLALGTACQADSRIKLGEQTRRSAHLYEWWITPERLKNTPQWRQQQGNPPLSLKRALGIAQKWIVKQEGGGKGAATPEVDTLTIASLHDDVGPYRFVYYYKIIFRVRQFDFMTCVVLMDGTVLQPERRLLP
jgi:hypothetical protein